jgi:hypothetical protein
VHKVQQAIRERDVIVEKIIAGLPDVKDRSARNFSVIADAMRH